MDAKDLVLGRQATEKEIEKINQANEILGEVGLEIVGTRPKDR